MTKTNVVTTVKKWCNYEIDNCTRFNASISHAVDRCYGIIMFVTNSLLDYDSVESKALVEWWDNEMLPKFRELEMR